MMKKAACIFLCAAILTSLCACAKDRDDTADKSQPAESSSQASSAAAPEAEVNYQAELDNIIKEYDFNGVVYITKDSKEVCSSTPKSSDESTGEITLDTQFCVGSISKEFAAVSILMLRDEGKLSVDDSLDAFFPEYEIGRDITVKNLLTMRSGVPDFYNSTDEDENSVSFSDDELPFQVYDESDSYDNQKALKEWLFNQPLDFEPDTNFMYSNSNYLLLSMIVEQASGLDYHTFIRDNIFKPLGMEHSTFIDERKSAQFLAEETSSFDFASYPGVSNGAGDIISTAGDIDLWLTALRENKLLSEVSFTEMTTNYTESESPGYGYGVMLTKNGGLMHTGKICSYISIAYTDPKKGYNLFAASNDSLSTDESINELQDKILMNVMK